MKRTDRLAIVALNAAGLETARNLQRVLGNGAVHAPGRLADQGEATFDDAVAHFRSLFAAGCPIAGVCASGILIRALAPLLADKHDEPPVVAVSVDGDVAVPLLGGHKGANRLAREIARQLDGVAAITTASESTSGVALDDPPPGWRLAEDSDIRGITSAMLNDEPVALKVDAGDAGWLRGAADWQADAPCTIVLSDRASATGDVTLRPASLVLGLGCERGADEAETVAFVEQVLGESDLAAESLAAVASLDLKADETAMRAVAAHFGVPLRLFDAATLEAETPRLANPSDIVYQAVGCHGVAEGAALAGAGPDGTLVVEKQKTARATCAIARGAGVVLSESIGHGLGRLTVVGIGPGTADWRTGAVASAISGARHLVGYSLYLDLLGAAAGHAKRHEFPLGAETERARAALDLAAGGEHVALVCSGDAGIYGMASLVFELLDQVEEPRWRFVDVRVEPGISAMQAAAARAGAPLGHDFCAISLSDLLTPWPAIERRLEAAADADFVIALYNPAGRKRRAPLNRALEILRSKRPAACPVIIARNLGREAENIRIVPLGELDGDSIDMLSVLIFGNSETRHGAGAGRAYAYTPRGYGRKNEGAA